jgi:multiple sugar transport system substrate-binding protein
MSWPEIREWLEADEEEKKKRGALDIFSLDPYSLSGLKSGVYPAAENEDLPALISFINPLFYNIELLKASGFDRPPKNQTEFLSYVQRISQSGGGAYGAGLALGDQDPQIAGRHLLSWIWAAAGNPETAENFRFNSRELTAALNFLNQLKQNLYSNPFRVSEEELIQAFSEGRIGMMIAPVSDIRELKTKLSGSFGITTIPGPESYMRKPVFPLTVWCVGVNQQSEHPEEAEKFISFLKDKAGIIAAAAYAVPGNGRRNPELSKNDPHYAKAFDMYEAGEVVREYRSPELSQLSAVIRREVELMFAGTKSPEQCAEAIQQRWEALSGAAES